MLAIVGAAGLLLALGLVFWTVYSGELEWFACGLRKPRPGPPAPPAPPPSEIEPTPARPPRRDDLLLQLQVTPSDFHRPRRFLS